MRYTKRMVLGCALGALLGTGVYAAEMTAGLDIRGGENAFSAFYLNRVEDAASNVLRLRLDVKNGQAIKGYGAVLHFDPARYEFIEARQAADNALDTGNGPPKLFLAVNNVPGQVALGAMKVDGGTGAGEGGLVEVSFRVLDVPAASDFRVAEGVLVDARGGLDAVQRVEVENFDVKPASFDLAQNVPNPFNPTTTISFQMPQAGQVRLAIYNALGQEVQTLVQEFRDAGHHTVAWNGRDALGRQVASGVYFYRLEADGFHQTRRMMMLK